MDLFEILKEFKKMQPEKNFTENSRRTILMHAPAERLSARRFFARSIAVASSLVLAGALIFIVAGGLSMTKLAPKFSSIDPTALRAEAQAIDTQINLLNVNYAENSVSTKSTLTIKKNTAAQINEGTSSPAIISSANTPATSTLSVDEILQGLSQ